MRSIGKSTEIVKNSNQYSYLHFINLLSKLEIKGFQNLFMDATEKSLLDYVALSEYQKHRPLVGELIALSQIGSPAMLHGRIKNLERYGFIVIAIDKGDQRKKMISLSKKGKDYYQMLSKYLLEAASEGKEVR